ncbi:transporter substrate-binding domain-containing protein [Shewanella sp. Isolate11]|uniref:transporter substrate-binding domain-containing protein n=1 Tax=Shewanella sp. Isolate11 TaxID=2908530 RepID=UPI001EFC99C8|nr:transporter substrate-binding domain-containing protein [Shewanella sp. Isolate11]MCG9696178.1 transporter substrate-binding domain-containing protein [Shewanella sp. Isolate11]
MDRKTTLVHCLLYLSLLLMSGQLDAANNADNNQTGSNDLFNEPLIFGIAIGFPPYQFNQNGQVAGFDADVAKALIAHLNQDYRFKQDNWDTVLNDLRFKQNDLIVGMEINPVRQQIFDFSQPYYFRQDAFFVLDENQSIRQVGDLGDMLIAGDRHSSIEDLLKQNERLYDYRLITTLSKADSMQRLASGKVAAAIMPKAVGYYLANQQGIKVRILDFPTQGTPVAIAVKKGEQQLLARINVALAQLINDGTIAALYKQWFAQQEESN